MIVLAIDGWTRFHDFVRNANIFGYSCRWAGSIRSRARASRSSSDRKTPRIAFEKQLAGKIPQTPPREISGDAALSHGTTASAVHGAGFLAPGSSPELFDRPSP